MNTSFIVNCAGLGVLTATLVGFAGCQSPDANKEWLSPVAAFHRHIPWKGDEKEQPGIPYRIEGNWVDAVMHQQGKIPQRGFGGRVFFYPERGEDSIPVEGELVVYAYAEDGRNATDNRPTRKYVYPADILAEQVRDTELGKSYDVWIPWDEMGGPQARVSLMCRFQPKLGAPIVSEQATLVLAGPGGIDHTPSGENLASPAAPQRSTVEQAVHQTANPEPSSAVKQAGYTTAAPSHGAATQALVGATNSASASGPTQIAATTIPLSRSFPIRRPEAGESSVISPAQLPSHMSISVPTGIGPSISAVPQDMAAMQKSLGASAATPASAGSAAQRPSASGLSQFKALSPPGTRLTKPVPQSQFPPIQVGDAGNQPMMAIPPQPAVQQPAGHQQSAQAQQSNPPNGGWSTFSTGIQGSPPNVSLGERFTKVNGQLVGS